MPICHSFHIPELSSPRPPSYSENLHNLSTIPHSYIQEKKIKLNWAILFLIIVKHIKKKKKICKNGLVK